VIHDDDSAHVSLLRLVAALDARTKFGGALDRQQRIRESQPADVRPRQRWSGDRRWFDPRHGDATDGDLDTEMGGDVPHEAGPYQTCYDVRRLRLVEPQRLPDSVAVNREIKAAAAPIVDTADERAIEILHRRAS
jgi:hypothetical protein